MVGGTTKIRKILSPSLRRPFLSHWTEEDDTKIDDNDIEHALIIDAWCFYFTFNPTHRVFFG
jgi:hypothetical protein